MEASKKRSLELKRALTDWVYEAEDELAVALETYVAEAGRRDRYDIKLQNLVVDTFLCKGEVNGKTPIELFIEDHRDLTASDRTILGKWQRSFTGLFEVKKVLAESFKLMNWLSAKHYTVLPNDQIPEEELKRFQTGEIILARIMPLTEQEWMFSGTCILKGKLGKPKLAVAIGEFKDNYPEQLYGDAPQLLEQAWNSVEKYHQEFVDFLGSDEVTLSGYELNKKIAQLQQQMSEKHLAEAGIDSSKSLQEIAQEAGVDEQELKNAALEEADPSEATAVAKAVENALTSPMVTPKADLPPEIKNAEQVTAFSDPRWGQMFIPSYSRFTAILETDEPQNQPDVEVWVRKYLEDDQINFYIWQKLKAQYPTKLEKVLQTGLNRPEFQLERDLAPTLREYGKNTEPQLPEIASVPLHLNNLFEEAVAQVSKSKSKSKKKAKKTKGFQ